MKAFLREHSSIYRSFDPPAQHIRICGCSELTATPIFANPASDTTVVHHDKHAIGEVWVEGGRLTKFCDGTEV